MAINKDDIFKCFVHDFGCTAPQEWRDHTATVEHTHVGETTCRDCGTKGIQINYTGKLASGTLPPAYCEDCKDRLRKELSK